MGEQIAPLPRATLTNGMTIAFEAIDPTTGLPVAGVKVSAVAIYDDGSADVELTGGGVTVSLPDTAPLWAPVPASDM